MQIVFTYLLTYINSKI